MPENVRSYLANQIKPFTMEHTQTHSTSHEDESAVKDDQDNTTEGHSRSRMKQRFGVSSHQSDQKSNNHDALNLT